MVGTTLKLRVDENAVEKYNQVQGKKLTAPSNEATTKRAALGDLQNRVVTRAAPTAKDAAHKELKDTKLSNALRNVTARVDTNLRKPLGASNGSEAGTTAAATGVVGRSNSIRTAAAIHTTGLSRLASSKLVAPTQATAKPKVSAEPVAKVGNKLKANSNEQLIAVAPALRREDSNLSRKSLTKLRAALGKQSDAAKVSTRATATALEKKEATVEKKDLAPSATTSTIAVTLSGKRLTGIEDIDAYDAENLMLVSEYVNDIYDYLYKLEDEQPIFEDHLAGQLEVTPRMRSVLIDWINEVHMQFHLAAETFHLAVAIIDRYLQKVQDTKRSYLQLVGVTALFIATKYEELFPPAIGDFVYITDDTYTATQIRTMEQQIFKTIDCNLSRPLPIHFLRRYSKAAGAEDSHHAMSKYFLELAANEYELASYKPSEIAAGSLFLALHLINGNARAGTGFNDKHWTSTLSHYSRYTAKHLRPITKQIAKLARNAPHAKLRTVYTKYQSNKFQKISMRSELYGPLMDSIVNSNKI